MFRIVDILHLTFVSSCLQKKNLENPKHLGDIQLAPMIEGYGSIKLGFKYYYTKVLF